MAGIRFGNVVGVPIRPAVGNVVGDPIILEPENLEVAEDFSLGVPASFKC